MLKRLLLSLFIIFSIPLYAQNNQVKNDGINILIATTETGDCQTGGLGDVLSPRALPGALAKLGANVVVVIPWWSHLDNDIDVTESDEYIDVPMPWGTNGEYTTVKVQLGDAFINGVEIRLIREPYKSDLFKSKRLANGKELPNYTGTNKMKMERAAFFSKAVLELAKHYGNNHFKIIMTNEWMTGLVPWYKKNWSIYSNLKAKMVHYVHSTRPEAQGIFDLSDGKYAQIDAKYLDVNNALIPGSLVHYGHLNITKGAALSADALRTVDPQTAIDLMDPTLTYSYSLQPIFKAVGLKGFPHGVDLDTYNPYTGRNIAKNYDATTAAEGKAANKLAVQKWLGLAQSETAELIVATSRISAQKSHKEMADAFEGLLPNKDIQIVIMGDGNNEDSYASGVKTHYEVLQEKYPTKFKLISYEENKDKQALLLAGADGLMMFSTEEYGGVDQRKAQVMGAIPIVNPIMGIKSSTVGPDDPQNRPQTSVYIKGKISVGSITDAIEEALTLMSDPEKLAEVRSNAMNMNFSWERSAKMYMDDFKSLVPERKDYVGVDGLQELIDDCPQKKWTLLTAYKEYPELFSEKNIVDFINSSLTLKKTREQKSNILTQANQIVTTLGMKELKKDISNAEQVLIENDMALLTSRFKEYTKEDLSSLDNSGKVIKMVDYFLKKNGSLDSQEKLSTIMFGTGEQAFADGLLTQMNNIIKNKTGDFTLNEKKLYLLCSLIITQNPIVYYDGNTVDVEDFLVNTYTSVSPMSYTMLTNVSTYFTEGGYKDLQIKDVDIDITLNADQITKSLKIIDEVNKSILSK